MIVLAAAQEVGGANALVPVIRELNHRGQAKVEVLACGNAIKVFSQEWIEHRALSTPAEAGDESHRHIGQEFASISPDVLLLGTAWGSSLDKALLRVARVIGTPSLAVVDMWSNYRERFVDPADGELRLPTKVAVMDELAFGQAVEAGLPAHCLAITGQPYLEHTARSIRTRAVREQAASLRRRWLRSGANREISSVVLFASEAVERHFGPDTSYYRGYTEVDALRGVVEAVRSVERRCEVGMRVAVKPHPEESPDAPHLEQLARGRQVVIVGGQPAWPCIVAADVVVGMTSMLLMESAIAGKPTISFQPGVGHTSAFVGVELGTVSAASSVEELASSLATLVRKGSVNGAEQEASDHGDVPTFMRTGSAGRVADLLVGLAAHRGPAVARGQK